VQDKKARTYCPRGTGGTHQGKRPPNPDKLKQYLKLKAAYENAEAAAGASGHTTEEAPQAYTDSGSISRTAKGV